MARRRERRHQAEAHSSHERWLITYADMITLLMVLFIVLFAVSQVDQKRFEELKAGMAAGFGNNSTPFQGKDSVLQEAGAAPMAPVRPDIQEAVRVLTQESVRGTTEKNEEQVARDADRQQAEEARHARDAYAQARAEVLRLEELRKRIAAALVKHGYQRDVAMQIDGRGLRISLVSRHIVFRANLADLTPRGARVLDVLAPVLRDLPDQIEIAGHTNQVKVKPKYYPTDWELSAARAVTVLRYLDENKDISTHNMSAVAYGHEQPLVDPKKPRSQALNKRVDIVVLSAASDEVRRLFTTVLEDAQL